MNSCNTIRSVELLYYYSYYCWCTYILARYTRISLLLYYLNLLSCLLWFSIFLVYISCFAFFLIQFNFPTTFFQKTVTQIYHIFRCEIVRHFSCSCMHLSSSDCIVLLYSEYYAKNVIRLRSFRDIFNCVLHVQSFYFLTYHWIRKWSKHFFLFSKCGTHSSRIL